MDVGKSTCRVGANLLCKLHATGRDAVEWMAEMERLGNLAVVDVWMRLIFRLMSKTLIFLPSPVCSGRLR